MSRRDDYYALETRARAKGYTTIGDLIDASGIDPEDLFYNEWDESLRTEQLYWSDAAHIILESMAEEGLI